MFNFISPAEHVRCLYCNYPSKIKDLEKHFYDYHSIFARRVIRCVDPNCIKLLRNHKVSFFSC